MKDDESRGGDGTADGANEAGGGGRRSGIDRRGSERRGDDRRSGGDRRDYGSFWRWPDRRRIASALLGLGATPLLTGSAPANTVDAGVPTMRDPGDSERRSPESALRGARLWVDPNSLAARQAQQWRSSRPTDAELIAYIAGQPTGVWLGEWSGDVEAAARRIVRSAGDELPVLVAYNIPNRDCNSYSAGGVGSADEYRRWIRSLAEGLQGSRALVVLEPDGVASVSCLTAEGQRVRFGLIAEAVTVLKRAGAFVYIDAGHARWVDDEEMAQRLHLAGIANADGFSLNVSNFISTEENARYGAALSRRIGGKHFIIDTSRNGAGAPNNEWCNPRGTALGTAPTTQTNMPLVDALLWIKRPGESDGTCNGGPRAGQWWPDYALDMARRALDSA